MTYIISMKTISLKLSPQEIATLKEKTSQWPMRQDIQYTQFQVKYDHVTITVYTSNKVVFAGENADFYARVFSSQYTPESGTSQQSSKTPTSSTLATTIKGEAMAGSDEVGTGDYFGPVVVCAAIVNKEDYARLPLDRIMDTKQMNDAIVREIGPILMKVLKHSNLILDNPKYNVVHKTHNMNVIKAKLHNKAFINLSKQYDMPKHVIIDQFLKKESYYKHLSNEPEVYRDLIFETKAENQFLAVACAAIIARYTFLDYFDKLESKFGMVFPKGGGKQVTPAILKFVERFGEENLYKVAKLHFVNTENAIGHPLT